MRSQKYLQFIREQKCCMCGRNIAIHAHHTTTGGMGYKGDDMQAVPLCAVHHAWVHNTGRKDNIPNLNEVIMRLQNKFNKENNK